MRAQTERNTATATTTTTTPRRILHINTATATTTTPPHDPPAFHHIRPSFLASLAHFLQRPHSLPFVLSLFLFLTWFFIRMQRSHRHQDQLRFTPAVPQWTSEGDMMANLARFSSAAAIPSKVVKDTRGWMLDPISLARASGISGGAVNCASIHVGEIRPGKLRGNHRHHDCNETFVIWGALTKFRLENSEVADSGYAEVTIGADDIVVAASPSHKAHALVNIDPVRSTFFIGCQDSVINYNASSTDFNVWKDL